MSFVEKIDLVNLPRVSKNKSYLTIVERKELKGSNIFFKKLVIEPFSISGQVCKKSSLSDIQNILDEKISCSIINNIFYTNWLKDMSNVCNIFCDIMESNTISFSLGTSRGCTRYHIDNVPIRLLVTYFGQEQNGYLLTQKAIKLILKVKKMKRLLKIRQNVNLLKRGI